MDLRETTQRQDALIASDERHRRAMGEASKTLRQAMEYERRGVAVNITKAALVWREFDRPNAFARGIRSDSHNAQAVRRAHAHASARLAFKERAEASMTDRDPCPRCGTRPDVGCKHRRVA